MAANDLFYVEVDSRIDGRRLLAITGHRDTVLEAAVRAILDAAPDWQNAPQWPRPAFHVNVSKFRATG